MTVLEVEEKENSYSINSFLFPLNCKIPINAIVFLCSYVSIHVWREVV